MANANREESSLGINYFEFNVEKKADKVSKLQRVGIVLLDIALAVVLLATMSGVFLMFAFCGFVLIFAILTFYLYKYTQIEYEYIISSGTFTMSKIYGRRTRKDIFACKVSQFDVVKPYSGENLKTVLGSKESKVYTCISSPEAMDIHYATFSDENGKKFAVIFEAPRKAISVLRYYNSKAFTMK